MQKKLEILIKILIGASFFVPLVVIPNSYIFPFIVPKIILFRSLVLLLLAAYLVLLSSDWHRYKIRLNLVNITVGLFFLSFAISTFVGVDWYRSFWDNHERMLGLFTFFHYVVYFYILTSVIKKEKDWKWLLRLFLLAGSLVMLVAVWQRFVNPEAFLNQGAKRVSATLGNAIYLSGYGLFLFFIGYFLVAKETIKLKSFWFWYAVAGATLGFLGIFLGGTRGTLLGLLVAFGILFICYIATLKEHKRARQILIFLILIGVVISGTLFIFRKTEFVRNIPAVGGLLNVSLSSGTANTRFMAWGIAVDAWYEKPVFGWGPNNYYYSFNKYYRPEFLEHGWGETWFDNAHNIVMNTLAVQGTFGILAYFGLFGVTIFVLWRGYQKREVDIHLATVGTAFLVGHFVHNIFVFENPTSYLYFFFFLAFINSRVNKAEAGEENSRISFGLIISTLLVISLFIFSTNINPARANRATLNVIKGLNQGASGVEYYSIAASIPSPHIDDIRNDFARYVSQLLPKYLEIEKVKEANELFDLAYSELKKNRDLHPLDIRVHLQQSQLAQFGWQLKEDPNFIFEAEATLEDALSKSPRRQQVIYSLAGLKMQLNKSEEAEKLLKASIEDDPIISEGWIRLAALYRDIGNQAMAVELLTEARRQNIVFTEKDESFVKLILEEIEE
ncbi:O-antigen ligase family protein [Patescibacteria group bacterium]|nr:O-antigen ligase family protein [Patescibacteria group bacterium]